MAFAADVLNDLGPQEELVELREVSVMTGTGCTPSATVRLVLSGREVVGRGTGVGPVDAASSAMLAVVRQQLGPQLELKEYGLKAITGGTDALAHAHILFRDEEGNTFRGEAINADVILASVHAMAKGVNRALNFQKKVKARASRTAAPAAAAGKAASI
jgi:2-isopropylmalate synthase